MWSINFKNWKAIIDLFTCLDCRKKHGKIYEIDEYVLDEPPLHWKCRCKIEPMEAKMAGTATKLKENGADWWLRNLGRLPDYYITKEEALALGDKPLFGNLDVVAPGKVLTKSVYQNRNGHLPSKEGRIWYEADINYNPKWGYRGGDRILFSNDGLIFVTYNHYHTFVEIV